jgi:magnesium-transporting ATPase (P-type)
VLAAVAVLAGVIAMSVNAPMEDPFERDARVLITTFGVGMAVLAAVVALVPFRHGEPWAWWVLWAWPVFFVAHVVALGTVVPDAVLAVMTAAALLAGRPSRR